ncbi:MAG: L-2,4-diaminobutyrate decarboxylase, partial [Candidatus Heimdallarchaeota archaeon LC_3]
LLLLGIGLKNIRIIETHEDFSINIDILKKTIENDKTNTDNFPAIIIANAGTTNTGAIDDLIALHRIAKKNNAWLHIDAAYGGFARISKTSASELLADINFADSIALDAHKWLFVPFEAGIVLVKNRECLKHAFSEDAGYLVDTQSVSEHQLMVNFWEYSFPMSREFRGLKVWMLINAYGREGLSNLITKNILLVKYLSTRVEEHPDLELMSSSELSIVCFRWRDSDEFNNMIIEKIQKNQKYYVSRTKLKGRSTIRVCIVNLESDTDVIDGLIQEIENIGITLAI